MNSIISTAYGRRDKSQKWPCLEGMLRKRNRDTKEPDKMQEKTKQKSCHGTHKTGSHKLEKRIQAWPQPSRWRVLTSFQKGRSGNCSKYTTDYSLSFYVCCKICIILSLETSSPISKNIYTACRKNQNVHPHGNVEYVYLESEALCGNLNQDSKTQWGKS